MPVSPCKSLCLSRFAVQSLKFEQCLSDHKDEISFVYLAKLLQVWKWRVKFANREGERVLACEKRQKKANKKVFYAVTICEKKFQIFKKVNLRKEIENLKRSHRRSHAVHMRRLHRCRSAGSLVRFNWKVKRFSVVCSIASLVVKATGFTGRCLGFASRTTARDFA